MPAMVMRIKSSVTQSTSAIFPSPFQIADRKSIRSVRSASSGISKAVEPTNGKGYWRFAFAVSVCCRSQPLTLECDLPVICPPIRSRYKARGCHILFVPPPCFEQIHCTKPDDYVVGGSDANCVALSDRDLSGL